MRFMYKFQYFFIFGKITLLPLLFKFKFNFICECRNSHCNDLNRHYLGKSKVHEKSRPCTVTVGWMFLARRRYSGVSSLQVGQNVITRNSILYLPKIPRKVIIIPNTSEKSF